MKKNILFVLLLLLIPLAQADTFGPPLKSYWGTVTFDSLPKPNASISVLDPSNNIVASATSDLSARYSLIVPWADTYTNTTLLTFKVNGATAITTAIGNMGDDVNLNLAASTSTGSGGTSSGGSSGSTSGSSGGGGGGGSSGENASNIEATEKYDLQISKDVLTSYRFTLVKNPIIYVNITGNTSLGVITASVEVLKSTSTLVKVPPGGHVYKNVNIWVGNSGFATPKNIKEGRVYFKVENTWITSGGFKDSDVVLTKWDGAKWIPLETSQKKKDGTFTYFEGKTTSFSPFAITAGLKEEAVTPAPQISPEKTPVSQPSTTPKPTAKNPLPGFELVFAIVAISMVLLLRNKKGQ
jgi:PGF-pre-PGF domain-containing protein